LKLIFTKELFNKTRNKYQETICRVNFGQSIQWKVNGNQNWLLIFFKNIIFCVLQKKVIQVWTQIRVRK